MTNAFGEARIIRPAEKGRKERGGGARTISLVTSSIGSKGLLNGITEFDPGAAIRPHRHNCEESVMVLEGSAILVVEDNEYVLEAHDTTWLPPGVTHCFRNASSTEPMKIFWVYASIDADRTLAGTNETHRIDEEHGCS